MYRFFDFIISLSSLILLSPLIGFLYILLFLESDSPIFKQKRIGYNQKTFSLLKFRTMKKNTKSVATHLVDSSVITPIGTFLRRTKLDEIPQLFNILFGQMSFVGPRPCLANQKKLIIERKKRFVFKVKPGLTGLAQLKGINMSKPTLLATTDLNMIKKLNLYYYFYYIILTLILVFKKKNKLCMHLL